MKTILVATDFSPAANNATLYAANFSAATKAKIILFHIYRMSIHAQNTRLQATAIDELMEISRKKLSEKANKLSEDHKIEVIPVWCMGDFQEELGKIIHSTQADIVVMGMATKSIEQDLLGNKTTAAVLSFKFPVLAIPINAVYQGLNTILFACNVTRGIHKSILEKVKDIAVELGASVEVFHASKRMNATENEKVINALDNLENELNETNYSYKSVESSSIIEAIEDEINRINADLLIMVPYKYGFWKSMTHISKTRIMASKSEIPLLSLPL